MTEARMSSAIPTQYNGTLFRSRLEARWACFFDTVKWPWAFEPVDLEFYIPDFILRFPAGDIAVEVKPETQLLDLRAHASKIIKSGWPDESLALGAVMFADNIIGVDIEPIDGEGYVTGAARIFRCIDCGAVSLLNDDSHWRCRVNGCYAGNAHIGEMDRGEVAKLWADAGNRVQWKGLDVCPG